MFSLFRRCSSWSTAVGSSLCGSRRAELETSTKVLRKSGFFIRKFPLVNKKIYLEDVTVHKQAIPSRHGVGYAAPFDEAKPTLPSPRFDHGAAVHADRYLRIFAGPLSMNDLQITHLPTGWSTLHVIWDPAFARGCLFHSDVYSAAADEIGKIYLDRTYLDMPF